MSRKPALHIMQALRRKPWAITSDALRTIAQVALRDVDALRPQLDAILAKRGAPLDNTRYTELRDGVAIIRVTGPMCRYASYFADVSGLTSYEELATDLRAALDNGTVRAILLQMDTPGGEVNGCAETAELIYAARGLKPIVAVASDMCCSGGLWLASACDEIIATPASDIGSIGVVCTITDYSAADREYGIETYTLVSEQSPKKILDVATEEGRAEIVAELNAVAEVFIAAIGKYRGLSRVQVLAASNEGRIAIGAQAVTQGLADRLSTTEAILAELAGGTYAAPARARRVPAARLSTAPEPSMLKSSTPVATLAAPVKRAYAAGDAVKSLVARESVIRQGETGTIAEVREGVTVCAVRKVDGSDARWLLADEEIESTVGAADDPVPVDPATTPPTAVPAPAPTAATPATPATRPTTAAEFAAASPAIAAELRAEGARAENARILEIDGLAPPGLGVLALACRADLTCTPAQAAKQFLEAQRAGSTDQLAALRNAERTMIAPKPLATTDPDTGSTAKRISETFELHRPRAARA